MKSVKTNISFKAKDVKKIANLAKVPVVPDAANDLAGAFTTTLAVVDKLFKVKNVAVKPKLHIINLVNVYREDKIDQSIMLSQKEALLNAKKKHDGYFVVKQVLDIKR